MYNTIFNDFLRFRAIDFFQVRYVSWIIDTLRLNMKIYTQFLIWTFRIFRIFKTLYKSHDNEDNEFGFLNKHPEFLFVIILSQKFWNSQDNCESYGNLKIGEKTDF